MITENTKTSEALSGNEIALLRHLVTFNNAPFHLEEAYSGLTNLVETKSLFYELFFGLQKKQCIYIVKSQPKTEGLGVLYSLTGVGKSST